MCGHGESDMASAVCACVMWRGVGCGGGLCVCVCARLYGGRECTHSHTITVAVPCCTAGASNYLQAPAGPDAGAHKSSRAVMGRVKWGFQQRGGGQPREDVLCQGPRRAGSRPSSTDLKGPASFSGLVTSISHLLSPTPSGSSF